MIKKKKKSSLPFPTIYLKTGYKSPFVKVSPDPVPERGRQLLGCLIRDNSGL